MIKCFECGQKGVQFHHVVPRSLGGTATVPLCEQCHSKVHDADLTTSYLTRLALAKVSREELCYVFYHLCNGTDDQLIKATCESLTGRRLSNKWVHKQAARLAKIATTDLLEMFQPILKASPEMLSDLSEDWEAYKQSEILNKKAIRHDS